MRRCACETVRPDLRQAIGTSECGIGGASMFQFLRGLVLTARTGEAR